ncbi:hypothetical protein CFIMG_006210RA [Ceratocystis fimbriata CBS 114723]|uniref:DUF4536 domain-containing protein n=1 Tax=Ceratocystis fimbriata CBS 114723 TaxID=1035309 RepID=A0A2C5WWQ4_9PEZI|nr:hypothetical protein CFIMG_006210RA [Ceratocystis fimbriata CBS 114723]
MSGKVPPLYELERPEKLSKVLKSEADEDCMPCKIIGSGAFLTLSGFNYFSGMSQLEKRQAEVIRSGSMFGMRSRRMGITGISVGLAYLGLYRLMA